MKMSIITACFNSGKTIEKTIKSVIAQRYPDMEYILIDAKSTDNTMEIVGKYQGYFTHIISEEDKGIADGFNKGILLATGDVIGIINADDVMYPGTAERLAEAYTKGIDIYYGDQIVIDKKNATRCFQKAKPLSMMSYCLPFCHQSAYITKTCYEKFGLYSLSYKLCLDYELILKMYKGGAKFKYINYPLCEYSFGGCTYIDPWKTNKEDIAIAMKYGLPLHKAYLFRTKYLTLCYSKRLLEKMRVLRFAQSIRQKFNKDLDYNTKF